MKKRLLAIIATLAMVVAMMPSMVFGATTVTTEQELKDALTTDGEITLGANITVNNTITVPADKTVTLDLNGHVISMVYTTDVTANHELLLNCGNLTIKDGSTQQTGKITYQYTGADTNFGKATNTITSNPASVLTIKGGTIENLTTANGIAYAVDGRTNGDAGDVTLVFEGGIIKSEKIAVRIFANSTTKTGNMNITGGKFYGRVQIHSANDKSNKSEIKISGGQFNANTYKEHALYITGSSINYSEVSAIVTGGEFNGTIDSQVEGFISGGTFSKPVEESYLAVDREQDEEGNVVCEEHSSASITSVVTAPTCTEDGYTTYTCGDCNYSWKADAAKAIGHTYKDGKCTVCGDKAPVKPEASPNTGDNTVAPFAVAGLVLAAMAAAVVARRRYN